MSASAGELNAATTAGTPYLANVLVGVEKHLKMAAEAMERAVAATAARASASGPEDGVMRRVLLLMLVGYLLFSAFVIGSTIGIVLSCERLRGRE